MSERIDLDAYFLQLALVASKRATCLRLKVGCVLVLDKHVLATGYNGSVRGQPHCLDVGCKFGSTGGCVRTVHAEANAIVQAALHGTSTRGATAYVTTSPCEGCVGLLANAGVVRVVYADEYRDPSPLYLAGAAGLLVEHRPW